MRLNQNKMTFGSAAVYMGAFLLLLVCNILTPYVVDDFRYIYSFYDGELVSSIWDIIMSMRVHRYHMNGRIVAHTLVQIFAMLPAWVFDVCNAAMYVFHIALLHKISMCDGQRRNAVLIILFCGAWVFCPAFGQVNLWQDGACNYLWSGVFALLFLMPYIEDYLYGKQIQTIFGKIMFLALAFCMGAYSETVSAAAIFMAMLLVLLTAVVQKRNIKPIWIVALATAFLGYVFIYTAPAQLREKGAEMKLSVLLDNFVNVAFQYWNLLGSLLVIFVLLLVLNLKKKTDPRRILLALVFLAGSLAANFIMMFASYYTTRSAIGAFVFLLGANGILLYPLAVRCVDRRLLAAGMVAVAMLTVPMLTGGLRDIYSTYVKIRENEAYIYRCREEGIRDVQLPVITTGTKYSAINGLKYLDTETPDIWPNKYMAVYYGVDSILGMKSE